MPDFNLTDGLPPLIDSYDLIVDARTPLEFERDHIPGATNLPVVDNDQYAIVGTLHRSNASMAMRDGIAMAMHNIAREMARPDSPTRLPMRAKVLVYCARGGKRSKLWLDAFTSLNYGADRLVGGWKAYRQNVRDNLEGATQRLSYVVLVGKTGVGKTRLLDALRARGEQVLDLEALAQHRGSLMGRIPGVAQPPQKMFDSKLYDELRRFDSQRLVWIEAEGKKIGNLQIPDALVALVRTSHFVYVDAPMQVREQVWTEDFGYFNEHLDELIEMLRPLVPLVGKKIFAEWEAYATNGEGILLFRAIMIDHYDVCYDRSHATHYDRPHRTVSLTGFDDASIANVVGELIEASHQRPDV